MNLRDDHIVKALLLYIEDQENRENTVFTSLNAQIKTLTSQNEELHRINEQLRKEIDDWVKKESGKHLDYIAKTMNGMPVTKVGG